MQLQLCTWRREGEVVCLRPFDFAQGYGTQVGGGDNLHVLACVIHCQEKQRGNSAALRDEDFMLSRCSLWLNSPGYELALPRGSCGRRGHVLLG